MWVLVFGQPIGVSSPPGGYTSCCCRLTTDFLMADARVGDVLSHGHLFGLKADVKSNVHFVEEHLVVYPCGHSVVFLHVESRAQQVRKRERERYRRSDRQTDPRFTTKKGNRQRDCPLDRTFSNKSPHNMYTCASYKEMM